MNRAVWIILNRDFELILDGEIKQNMIVDKKFTIGNDIWTPEIPKLKFSDEEIQKDYDNFTGDVLTFFMEPQSNSVLIDAKIGEESEYMEKIIIRKIEEYDVEC